MKPNFPSCSQNPRLPALLALLGFMFAMTSLPAAPPADGPVGLVGQGYGWLEVRTIMEHVLDREMPGVAYEEFEGRLEPEEFDRFRAVVVAGSLEEPYTASESHQIEQYVRSGGTLVLIQQAPKNFFIDDTQTDRKTSYLFGRSSWMRQGPLCVVFAPKDPLFEGVFDLVPDPFWLTGSVMVRGTHWESLAGIEEHILVGRMPMEQGTVYYLGHELFRVINRGKQEFMEQEVEGWVRILKNVLTPK